MEPARPSSPVIILSMKDAAEKLSVSIEVLLKWNELNILKPTITSTGEIGYSEEQITQFIAIQKISKPNNPEENQGVSTNPITTNLNQPTFVANSHTQNNYSQVNNYNIYPKSPTPSTKNKKFLTYFGIMSMISIFVISLSFIAFSQQLKINSLIYQKQLSYEKNLNNNLTSRNALAKQNTNINDDFSNNKSYGLTNEGADISKNKMTPLNKAFEKESNNQIIHDNNQVEIIGQIVGKEITENIDTSLIQTNVNNYAQQSNFIKSSDCPDCEEKNNDIDNKVFDAEGNIKVSKNNDTQNKMLASALGVSNTTQNQNPIQQNPGTIYLFGFLLIAMIIIYSVYGTFKQPALSPSNLDILNPQPYNLTPAVESRKVIEVFQKTDGTVVFKLQGNEYKISKPELDSESDKFIQRIMELSSNEKEFEYDCLSDDKLAFSAPLSKIVTRLGFVGIKRDLFFPRTSKTRVYFRKYLTEDDLLSINYTPEEILNEFIIN